MNFQFQNFEIKKQSKKFKGEIKMKKPELKKQEVFYLTDFLLKRALENKNEEEITFEDFITEGYSAINQMEKPKLMEKITKEFYEENINEEIIPNTLLLLNRYIEFAIENNIDEGTNIKDIYDKTSDIRELWKGYLYEISMFFAKKMRIETDIEFTRKKIAGILSKVFLEFSQENNFDESVEEALKNEY